MTEWIDWWTVVRFFHIVGATVWVGGQLTITVVLLPQVRRVLEPVLRAGLLKRVGKRFAMITGAWFLPNQIITGILLAWHHGVTWGSLLEAGYGRVLASKLLLFAAVMTATTLHGIAQAKGKADLARAASITALVGSLGIVLLATGLVEGGS